jgi:dimeric dUTPase (all-alpha-NTP-PPase superfamily)
MSHWKKLEYLQIKQRSLDDFIIQSKGITIVPTVANEYTERELLKNMYMALYDEIMEIKHDIENAEEWIDALHFILSIANRTKCELGVHSRTIDDVKHLSLQDCHNNLLHDFNAVLRRNKIFKHWSTQFGDPMRFSPLINSYLQEMVLTISDALVLLGKDMIKEYELKHDVNVVRQENNY